MTRVRLALGLLLGVAARSRGLVPGQGLSGLRLGYFYRRFAQGSASGSRCRLASSASEDEPLPGVLYLVPVPIGNVEDITLRALKILRGVDLIACEDTRNAGMLLKRLGVTRTPHPENPKALRPDLLACYEQVEKQRVQEVVRKLVSRGRVAMITDAGTPAISDPGCHVVKACAEAGLEIVSLPGACAAVVALAGSGFASGPALLYGFIPQKRGAQRAAAIEKIVATELSVVLYEAPHRLRYTLEELEAAGSGDREVMVARELTKRHEQIFRGTVKEAREACRDSLSDAQEKAADTGKAQIPLKGEFTIVLGPVSNKRPKAGDTEANLEELQERIRTELLTETPPSTSQLSKVLSKEFGVPRKVIYSQILAMEDDADQPGSAGDAGGKRKQ